MTRKNKSNSNSIHIGKWDDGNRRAHLDLDIVLRSNLLVQAASGGGKSWALRLLAEQCFGKVPIVIIDIEGEFASLREKYGFILCGPGGETPADPRSAAMLAHKVLELRASIICDIFELSKANRTLWVKNFLDALVDAPKRLWGSLLIFIDEAHELAPEPGRRGARESGSVSTAAVIDTCAKGRKRGYGTVLFTQRLGKLHADARAECKNVLMGLTFQDIDRERAVETLGIRRDRKTKEAFYKSIRLLEEGYFYGLGRAISLEPRLFMTGDVKTTHPEAGRNRVLKPPPPPAKIRHLLPQLKDLPQEAAKEATTVKELKAQVRKLQAESRLERATGAVVASQLPPQVIEKEVPVPVIPLGLQTELRKFFDAVRVWVAEAVRFRESGENIHKRIGEIEKTIREAIPKSATGRMMLHSQGHKINIKTLPREPRVPRVPTVQRQPTNGQSSVSIHAGARRMLEALAATHGPGLTKRQIGTLAGLKSTTGTFSTYLSSLRSQNLIDVQGKLLVITEEGRAEAGTVATPASRDELLAQWKSKVGRRPFEMLEVILNTRGVDKVELAANIGISHTTGTFSTYLSTLRSNGLIESPQPGYYEPSSVWEQFS